MAAAKTNTTKKHEDGLLLYRMEQVEKKVDALDSKLSAMDNIKRSDLLDLGSSIIDQFKEMRDNLQKQIDEKADQKQVDDLRTLIKAVASILGSIITGLVIFYLTQKQ